MLDTTIYHTMKMIRAYANSVEAYVAHVVVDGRIQHGSAPYAEKFFL